MARRSSISGVDRSPLLSERTRLFLSPSPSQLPPVLVGDADEHEGEAETEDFEGTSRRRRKRRPSLTPRSWENPRINRGPAKRASGAGRNSGFAYGAVSDSPGGNTRNARNNRSSQPTITIAAAEENGEDNGDEDEDGDDDEDDEDPEIERELTTEPDFWRTVGYLVRSSTPMIIGFIIEGLLQMISTAIVGRLGPIPLAIVGQGNQLIGVTGSLVVLASTSAQMTLSAPLFTSKTNAKTDVGVVAQRTFVIANLCSIPVAILWLFVEDWMRALGQPEGLCVGLRSYMRWALLAIPGYALMEIAKSYLQAQGIFHPPTVIAAIVLPIHTALTWYLVHHTSLAQNGAVIALALSEWIIGLGLILWIGMTRAKQCWGGLTRRSLRHWDQFLGMMIPAIFMYGSEWWSFEIVSLFAGRLGNTAVAAQAAVTSLDLVLALIPVAGAVASLARLGNIIGFGKAGIRHAKVSVRAAYAMMISYGCILAVLMVIFREQVSRIFTDDEETIELMKAVLLPMAAYQIFDAIQGCGGSVLRALAKQHVVATIHIVAYYVIAIPGGYYVAFHYGWGLPGLWAGLSFGLTLVSLTELALYVFWIDWEKEMESGERRRIKATH